MTHGSESWISQDEFCALTEVASADLDCIGLGSASEHFMSVWSDVRNKRWLWSRYKEIAKTGKGADSEERRHLKVAAIFKYCQENAWVWEAEQEVAQKSEPVEGPSEPSQPLESQQDSPSLSFTDSEWFAMEPNCHSNTTSSEWELP